MSYTLHPLISPSAFPSLVDVASAAFADHPVIPALFANVEKDAARAYDVRKFNEAWEKREAEGWRFFVVRYHDGEDTEGEGEIVAWAKWQFPHGQVHGDGEGEVGEGKKEENYPQGTNVELYEEFFGKLTEGRRKWVGPKEYFLEVLAVHPSHQRRSLGSMLIKAGLDMADRDGARTYIEASAKGLPLYLRHGWEPIGATTIDMRKYRGAEVVVEKTLIREPRTIS